MDNRYLQKSSEYYNTNRPEILSLVTEKVDKILDIGCSNGNFAKSVKDNNLCNYTYGIEPFEASALKAKEILDFVINEPVENALEKIDDNSIDIIFFNDVLEHLINPENTLVLCKNKLKSNGKIICSVPNVGYYWNLYNLVFKKKWEYTKSGILDETHLRFFTRSSLINTFERAGYKIEKNLGNEVGKVKLSKRISLLNKYILKGALDDSVYSQFLIVASKK